eukprot:3180275-Pyramimonas_sp.AAC.1
MKGLMLEEGVNLTAQGLQNLKALTRGQLEYSDVSWALRQMDASGSERLLPGRSSGNYAEGEDPSEQIYPPPSSSFPVGGSEGSDDLEYDEEEDDDIDLGDEAALLAELEDLDLGETQIEEALAMMESRPAGRTWKHNKDIKRAAKRDREYFDSKKAGTGPSPPRRLGGIGKGRGKSERGEGRGKGRRPRLSPGQLMKIT